MKRKVLMATVVIVTVTLALMCLHRFSGRAYSADPAPSLFVGDVCSNAITAYPAGSNGDVSPLALAPTGLSEPRFVAIDGNGNIYVANTCNATITIYAKGSNGIAAPTAIIGGPNTGLGDPTGIAVDSSGKIYVTDLRARSLFVYPPLGNSTGLLNEPPTASIGGPNTGLTEPEGVALDSSANIYVTDFGADSVHIYPALGSSTGQLNEAPTATINGGNTALEDPVSIALDSSANIYVADESAHSVFIYPALGSSTGTLNEAPTATINGSNTGLVSPIGVALDANANIYVTDDSGKDAVDVYPAVGSSTGTLNEAPTATISGSNTGLRGPQGLALDSGYNIYVVDGDNVFVYPALGSSTGLLNEAASAAISTTITTGAIDIGGVALDSSNNIYVTGANVFGFARSVFVYPAGSNGNTTATATISGSNTGLRSPSGIALDSNGNIYVLDGAARSVFVYPALGNSTGQLNEAPTATISGSNTGLEFPQSIALDSNGNIYVLDPDAGSVFVYPALGNSTGQLNEAPTATISGSNTGLRSPSGIALDSGSNIYVADASGSVLIYPPLGNSTGPLNEAATAIISGSNTGLGLPVNIALDSGSNIYVVDETPPNVLAYPPLGNSTGRLNEPPTATISGPQTELGEPLFIAIEPGVVATPTSTTTATATQTGTATATETPTATATATATASETATATATATITATPTATPTPTGEGLEELVVNPSPPSKLNFGTVSVGTTSASQTATIASEFNDDTVDFFGTFIIANFVQTGSTCGSSLAPLQSCQVDFACKPKTTGSLIGAYAFLYSSSESGIRDGDDFLKIGVVQFTCTGG